MDPKNLNIGWAMLSRLFFMVILGWILYLARDVVAALLLAIVISTAFDPIVSLLEKKKIPRILGTLIIYILAIFVIGLIIYTFVPLALSELNNLLLYSNELLGPVSETLNVQGVVEVLTSNLNRFTDVLFSGNLSLIEVTSRFLGGVFFALAIFALSFYLTVGRGGVEKFLIAVLPAAYEAKVINIYVRVTHKIGRWLTGQIFISLIVGLVTFLGLWLLGVKYSLLLGILAAVLEIIPYVGPIFVGSLAILVGLGESLALGVYAFILFTIIQQLENHILMPLVMRFTTALNPVVILTALLIGGKVFGVFGLILAVPIAVIFQEMLEDWTETKQSRRGLGL